MNPKCKQVIENLSLHRNPDLTHQEKVQLKGHLIECTVCQAEHEEMLHIAAILESLPEPVPPLDLVERIQTRIRQGTGPRNAAVLNSTKRSTLSGRRDARPNPIAPPQSWTTRVNPSSRK